MRFLNKAVLNPLFTAFYFFCIFQISEAFAQELESFPVKNINGSKVATIFQDRGAIQPGEIAVLVNDNDLQSKDVAAYYQIVRNIPAQNIIHLNFPVSDTISASDFAVIKAKIDAAAAPNIQGFAVSWSRPWQVIGTTTESITSSLALGYSTSNSCKVSCCTDMSPSPYYNSYSTKPFTDYHIRPAMMLAGENTLDVIALIDRGNLAQQNIPANAASHENAYLIRTQDASRSYIRWYDFQTAQNIWGSIAQQTGLSLNYLDQSVTGPNFIQNAKDVMFYFTGLVSVPGIETNTYLPGAIADHVTSFGGMIFTNTGQMTVLSWLKAGVTASYGTVLEPCAILGKFPLSQIVLSHYYQGETALEAYWKSVYTPGEGLFVGDPLARPYGTAATLINGKITVRTTSLFPRHNYALYGSNSANGPYTFLTSTSINDSAMATFTAENVNYQYFKIALFTGALPAPTYTPSITPTPRITPMAKITPTPKITPTATFTSTPLQSSKATLTPLPNITSTATPDSKVTLTPTPRVPVPTVTGIPKVEEKLYSISGHLGLNFEQNVADKKPFKSKLLVFDRSGKKISSKVLNSPGKWTIKGLSQGLYTIQLKKIPGLESLPEKLILNLSRKNVRGLNFKLSQVF
jgi:uncharacterized protein (TIGR03790 family)